MKGQLLLIGREQLNTFSVSSIFPNKPYNFINANSKITGQETATIYKTALISGDTNYYTGLYKQQTNLNLTAMDFVNEIQRVQSLRIPWRCVLTQDGKTLFNKAAYITSFNWGRDAAGDIAYDLSFTEYKFAERTPDELGKQTAPADAQDTYEVETIITTAEASAQTGTLPEGEYTKLYTARDVEIAANAISNEFGGGTGYYIQSDAKPLKPSESTSGTWVNAKTLTAAYAWVYCNIVDAGNGSGNTAAAPGYGIDTLTKWFNFCTKDGTSAKGRNGTGMIAYVPGKKAPYTNSRYGFDISEIVTDVFNRYSAEKAGLLTQQNSGRVVPQKYCSYTWNSYSRWSSLGTRTDTINVSSQQSTKYDVWNFAGIVSPYADCPGER